MKNRNRIDDAAIEERDEKFVAVAPDLPPILPKPDDFSDLYDKYINHDKIILQPDFQRDFIWTVKKQKELIKSVWQGIPIPMFYFSHTKDNKLEVIDGQQRLTTLFGFYNINKLPKSIRKRILKNVNLKDVNGKRIPDEEIRRKMERELSLHCVLFDECKVNDSQKYEIFRRLNQGSMNLKPQEIRNCIMQSMMPYFNSKIRALARLFKTRFGEEFNFTRMLGEELVLRYFVIRKYGYEKRVSDYINFSVEKRLETIKNDFSNKEEIDKYAREFKIFIDRMHLIFGSDSFQVLKKDDEQPVRNSRWDAHTFSGVFNQGLFHLFSFYLPKYNNNQFHRADIENIRYYFLKLLKNKKFSNLITGSGTDQTRKIKESKEVFETVFLNSCLGIWTVRDDRNISWQAKKTLFRNIPYCYLCYGKLNEIEEADHIDPYSKGSKSTYSNVLLAHSRCNREKSDSSVAEYRECNDILMKRILKNNKFIKEYLKCLRSWNNIYRLNNFKQLVKYAFIDRRKQYDGGVSV